MLADTHGGKWLYGLNILITSLLGLLVPVAAQGSVYALLALRIMQGMSQGFTFPAVYALAANWLPVQEKQRLFTLMGIGTY